MDKRISIVDEKIKTEGAGMEVEAVLLGALMIEDAGIEDIADIITSDMFFYPEHREVYDAIHYLYKKNIGIDLITVSGELRKRGKLDMVGGAHKLVALTNQVGSAAHVEAHAFLLRQHYLSHQLAKFGYDTYKKAISGEGDVIDLLDETGRGLSDITDTIKSNTSVNISKSVLDELNMIEARMAKAEDGKVLGVPTGFRDLDRITGGWQNDDLIIVAARPAMGKTALSVCLSRYAAKFGNVPVAYFSLEMSTSQLTCRLMSAECEIPSDLLRSGRLTKEEYSKLTTGLDELVSANLIIDDTPALSIMELKSRSRRLKQIHDVGLIVVDYLQLMSGTGKNREGNREQEISNISRGLKAIAKELHVPVIALSQLSRATETRGGEKRPQLSDLRESGAIEADADIVIFIYRGEYYGMLVDADGETNKDRGELIIAKHRNGSLANVKVQFHPEFTKFTDIEYSPELPSFIAKNYGGIVATGDSEQQHKRLVPMKKAVERRVDRIDEDVPF